MNFAQFFLLVFQHQVFSLIEMLQHSHYLSSIIYTQHSIMAHIIELSLIMIQIIAEVFDSLCHG